MGRFFCILVYICINLAEMLAMLQGLLDQPEAWQSATKGDVSKARLYFDKEEVLLPLYTHPPAPLEMLDDDEWTELWIECSDENGSGAEIEMSLFSEKVQQAFCTKNNLTLEKL